jgi:hypothetical protein
MRSLTKRPHKHEEVLLPSESVASSVSGIRGAARRPAADGRVCSVSWAVACPIVTGVVRCDPVVRGPDVAPMWPRRSRAWKARPGSASTPHASPMAQVIPSSDRPLLTVADRQLPMLRARGGHGRRGRTRLGRCSDGHHLNRRVRPVLGDHLPHWQAPARRAPAHIPHRDCTLGRRPRGKDAIPSPRRRSSMAWRFWADATAGP